MGREVIDLNEGEYKIEDGQEDISLNVKPNSLQELMEYSGYYPTREIVLQTALNILKMVRDGQVGQGIHAICLDGPPGAGKSFYAKTYQKLLKKLLNENVEMVSYQCNTSTSKAELYEEINVAAAIAGDANKVIIAGKLVEAIDLVNEGKRVLVFLDEYDKAREETDTFLLNFLQDGEVDTTQRGKVKVKEEFLRNLQVVVCKNDSREELSGPLTRRLKFLKLDYMRPSILRKTIDRVLSESNWAIRDAVTLLYTAMYENLERFPFSRLPACSECMQAIKDADTLMEIGADKTDIVTTAIIANMVKGNNDLEIFIDLTKSNSVLIEWYNRIIDAMGRNSNENELQRVKQEMARSFYPEQLKMVTGELEEKKAELQNQIQQMKNETNQYSKKLAQLKEKEKELEEKESDLEKRENETKELRKNAQQDAKDKADEYLKNKEEELQKEFDEKDEQLKQFEEEVISLRDNAEKDALQKAEELLQSEREKIQQDFSHKEKKLLADVEQKIATTNATIEDVNNKITGFNFNLAEYDNAMQVIEEQKAELSKQKELIEKLLIKGNNGFEIEPTEEVQEDINNEGVQLNGKQNLITQDLDISEIQDNKFSDSDVSVFDKSNTGQWTEIGHLTIETNNNKDNLVFNDMCSEKLSTYLKEKKNMEICKDGLIIYKGMKTNIIAVRTIEKDGEEYKNVYRFYSNTIVIPIQSLVMIMNLVGNINKKVAGYETKNKNTIDMELGCVICSSKEHSNGKEYSFEKLDDEIYILNYKNESQNNFKVITDYLFKELNCSTKDMSEIEKETIEKETFIKHIQYTGTENPDIMSKINRIIYVDENADKEIEL